VDRPDRAAAVYRELAVFSRRARALGSRVHPDLSLVAYTLLAHISTGPGVRATDLARHYNLDKSTVSRQLATLDELGMIAREGGGRAGQDIVLTPKGEQTLAAANDSMREAVTARLAGWSSEELERFAGYLELFNAQADEAPREE
jgi:DNA-binding MarR family transcriptional regulator